VYEKQQPKIENELLPLALCSRGYVVAKHRTPNFNSHLAIAGSQASLSIPRDSFTVNFKNWFFFSSRLLVLPTVPFRFWPTRSDNFFFLNPFFPDCKESLRRT
jgi:hypothetical protein